MAMVCLAVSTAEAAFTGDRLGLTPLAAADAHTFVLLDGTIFGWGFDSDGRLGTGLPPAANRLAPTVVAGLRNVDTIATGSRHALALLPDGTVWAWGQNDAGQLGDGTKVTRATPIRVPGLSRIIAIGAGPYSSFAVGDDGIVWAWGMNDTSQLGLGAATAPVLTPRATYFPRVRSIVGGRTHTLAIDYSGRVWAVGYGGYGQVGTGTWGTVNVPTRLDSIASSILQVSAGSTHSLAVDTSGSVWAWGQDSFGQLGNDAAAIPSNLPLRLTTLSNVKSVAAGGSHSLALTRDGKVYAWGHNDERQLGDFTTTDRFVPVPITTNPRGVTDPISFISAGSMHSMGVSQHGEIFGWGRNANNQIGLGTGTSGPVDPRDRSLFTYPFEVLVVMLSGSQEHTSGDGTEHDLQMLSEDLLRMSYGKLRTSVTYAGAYHATAQQIGCSGGDDDEATLLYGLQRAKAAGIKLERFAHVVYLTGFDMPPGCASGNAHGGVLNDDSLIGQSGLLAPGTGIAWIGPGMGGFNSPLLLLHEFEHGYGKPLGGQSGGVNSHVGTMWCEPFGTIPASIFSDSCSYEEVVSVVVYPLGHDRHTSEYEEDGVTPVRYYNEIASYKSAAWNWIPPSRVAQAGANSSVFELRPIEESVLQPFPATYTARIPNRSADDASYYLEYRTQAHGGPQPDFANQPGVYLSLFQYGLPFVIQATHDAASYHGVTPLSVGSWIQVEPGLRVFVASVGETAKGYIEFDGQAAPIPCSLDWSVCPAEYTCDGRMCGLDDAGDGRDR